MHLQSPRLKFAHISKHGSDVYRLLSAKELRVYDVLDLSRLLLEVMV